MRALVAALALCSCDKVYGLEGRGVIASDDGLVAWFTMDSIGDTLEDSSASGLVGLCDNAKCPTVAPSGVVDGALHFDGDTAVGANSMPALETPNGFTIAAWFRIDVVGVIGFACPFNKVSSAAQNSWQVCLFPGATGYSVQFLTDNNGDDDALPGGEVDVDRFHHVALWWDGATMEKRIYVDGLMKASKTAPTVFTGGLLGIGADYDNGAVIGAFTGDLDDLRVYDRTLDTNEIAALVQLGSP